MSVIGNLVVGITGDISGLQKATRDTKNLTSDMGDMFNKLAGIIAAAFSVKVIADFVKGSVREFASFETSTARMFADMADSSDEFRVALIADVNDIAKQYGIMGTEVAEAFHKALDLDVPREKVKEFMGVAAELSKVLGVDLTSTASTLAKTVQLLGGNFDDTRKIADMLFAGVEMGDTDLQTLGMQMGRLAPLSDKLGISIETIVAAIGTMVAQGQPSRSVLSGIQTLLDELDDTAKGVGKTFNDLAGRSLRDFIAAGGSLQSALELLAKYAADSGKSLGDLFSSMEAGKAALSLTGEHAAAFAQHLKEISDGTISVAKGWGVLGTTLEEQFKKIGEWWDSLKRDMGAKLKAPLEELIKFLDANKQGIEDFFTKTMQRAITVFDWLERHGALVKTALLAIAAGFAALAAVKLAAWILALDPLTLAFVAMAGIAVALGVAVSDAALKLKEFGENLIPLPDRMAQINARVKDQTDLVNDLILAYVTGAKTAADVIPQLQRLLEMQLAAMSESGVFKYTQDQIDQLAAAMNDALMQPPDLAVAYYKNAIAQLVATWAEGDASIAADTKETMLAVASSWGPIQGNVEAVTGAIEKSIPTFRTHTDALNLAGRAYRDLSVATGESFQAIQHLNDGVVALTRPFHYVTEAAGSTFQSIAHLDDGLGNITRAFHYTEEAVGTTFQAVKHLDDGIDHLQQRGASIPGKFREWWVAATELGQAMQRAFDSIKTGAEYAMGGISSFASGIVANWNEAIAANLVLDKSYTDTMAKIAQTEGDTVNELAKQRAKDLQNLQDNLADGKISHEQYAREVSQIEATYAADVVTARGKATQARKDEEAAYKAGTKSFLQVLGDTIRKVLRGIGDELEAQFWKAGAMGLLDLAAGNLVGAGEWAAAAAKAEAAHWAVDIMASAIPFDKGGIVAGALGEPVPAIVHGGEMVLTPEQQAAVGIDYARMGEAVAAGVYDALTEMQGRGQGSQIILEIDGNRIARAIYPGLLYEAQRRGTVIVPA